MYAPLPQKGTETGMKKFRIWILAALAAALCLLCGCSAEDFALPHEVQLAVGQQCALAGELRFTGSLSDITPQDRAEFAQAVTDAVVHIASTDPSVAAVDQDGNVTAVTPGTATVLVSCVDLDFYAEVNINVVEAATPESAALATPQGWSQTMQNCPKVAAALDNGVLTVSGFDFTTGKKLVVQLAGLQPARGSSFGGQGIPVGEGGVLQTVHETDYMVRYPAVGMDLPLNAPCFPVDQTIQDGQAVNFGYMLRPPHGDSSALPDGTNNAWCNAAYTVTDANGQVMGCFRVGAGQPVGAGRWDAPLPQICPQSDTQYTVTLTLTAVQDAAGSGPSGTAQAACSSTAQVFVQP